VLLRLTYALERKRSAVVHGSKYFSMARRRRARNPVDEVDGISESDHHSVHSHRLNWVVMTPCIVSYRK